MLQVMRAVFDKSMFMEENDRFEYSSLVHIHETLVSCS
jgi:hypothetical protein